MGKNILVAPNSFKECADSVQVAKIIGEKLNEKSSFNVVSRPLSDGGDGFLNVCKSVFQTEPLIIYIRDSFERSPTKFTIQIDNANKNVFIESADLFGLKLLNENQRNPLKQNSEVLGKIISYLNEEVNSKRLDINSIWIGVGGTSTIDFGMGALSQLGLSLINKEGEILESIPQNFSRAVSIKFNKLNLPFKIRCIVDVETELIAEPGAIEFYGRQKGASEEDLKIIKNGIKNILDLISTNKEFNVPKKLNGAGGGLASGLNIFLDSQIIRAEDFIRNDILNNLNLDEIDAVITGEGSFDFQSFEGKGSGVILNLFKNKSIPIFLINGSTRLSESIKLPKNITIINIIDFFNSREKSILNYQSGIVKATEIVINQLNN